MRILVAGSILGLAFSFSNLSDVQAQTFVEPPTGTSPNTFGPAETNQPSTTTSSISISPSSASQCGFSLYANQQFSNSGFRSEFGFVYSSNPCVNQEKTEKIRQQYSVDIKKIDLIIQYNTECIRGRAQAVVASKDPDLICLKP
jgi:hypothetical protein